MHFKKLAAKCGAIFATAFVVTLAVSAAAQAKLPAPRPQSPSNRKHVQALPAFTWKAVKRAASYQFEFSANGNFSSGVNGWSSGPMGLDTTAITNSSAIPDGTYHWRVRAVSKSDVPGRWSSMRTLTKRWSSAPKLTGPVGKTISWPAQPLLLKWNAVPYAVNYQIEIGTSPALSTLVYGPETVQGRQFVVPKTLSPGKYYWAVRPVDAAGQAGVRSAVASFTWAWPSNTSLTESDASPDSTYDEPTFSWTPIAGASSYEVQVATNPAYPSDAIILDSRGLVGTTYTPTNFFPNHTALYWRVRAIDANNDAGAWNTGENFNETFDSAAPSIPNMDVVGADGTPENDPTTNDPIVRWNPVPGASKYNVTISPWSSGTGCDFNAITGTSTYANTAWTPIGRDENASWQGSEYGWPGNANGSGGISISSGSFCVSVIAIRSDGPLAGSTIESAPTVLGNSLQPAFTYNPSVSGTLSPGSVDYSPGIVPPDEGSAAVPAGSTLTTAPLFEWQSVPGADGYYVIVANDANFDPNSIVNGVYTNTTAWVPTQPLPDQTGAFWWEVIPVTAGGQPLGNAEDGTYDPQQFNKNSTPPPPVSPVDGANVPTQPTFSWSSAQGAANYTLEISTDSTFANPIQTITTDSTRFTSTSTLPAGETLYWRVRANDVSYNLNWSRTETFTHNVPAPSGLVSRPANGATIPLLSWAAVTGASGYNVEVSTGTGSSVTYVTSPDMTPAELFSPGISKLHVQAVFPGDVRSAFGPATTYKRTIPAPSGVHATKAGTRIMVTWKPDGLAKYYNIQLSTTPGFESPIAGGSTADTAWVPQITSEQASTKLYWRLQGVDYQGNGSAYRGGTFKAPAKRHKATKKKRKRKKH